MASVTFSARVSLEVMEKSRDVVSSLDSAESLTLGLLAENAMKRQISAARRRLGGIPSRPDGESAGIPGRRPGSARTHRVTYCAKVNEEVRETWRDLAYLSREKKDVAELFELALLAEIRVLERRHGEVKARQKSLRPGRKIK